VRRRTILKKKRMFFLNESCEVLSREAHVEEEIALDEARIEYTDETRKKLESQSTLADVFDICLTGTIGTINGLRLGKIDRYNPPWDETNAAFGHVVLLLELIMHRIKIKEKKEYKWAGSFIENFRIRALGSKSRIENRKDKSILPLYSTATGTGWIPWLISESEYDKGLETFLQCLKELEEYACKNDPAHWKKQETSISIFGDKIESSHPRSGPYSIRYNFSSIENWTIALKIMLNLVKQILVWFDKTKKKTWS